MKHLTRFFFAIAAVTFLSLSASAQGFEGVVTMQITVPQMGEKPIPMTINIKGKKVMTETDMPMGKMMVFKDGAADKTTIVMPAMKMGYEIDHNATKNAASAADSIVPVKTTQTKTINGYNCTLYTAEMKGSPEMNGMQMNMWMTGDMPKNITDAIAQSMNSGMNGMSRGGSDSNPFESLMKQGLVPIEAQMTRSGQEIMDMKFVKYEQKKIDDALFTIPSDIKIQQMPAGAMMHGHGGGGQ